MTRILRRWANRLLGSVFGSRRENDLADELASHIQLLADDWVRRGLPPDEARRRARLEFGSVDSAKETCRDQRGLPLLDTARQDLRYAFRGMRRNPGFAAVAILSLTIGIGANTAIFSVVNSVLLRPLPFKDPERLFAVRELSPRFASLGPLGANPVHAREWAERCPSIEQGTLIRGDQVQLVAGGEPASFRGVRVAPNAFSLFGVQPIHGRAFLPEEDREGRDRVVMLSESVWRARFHADLSVIGMPVLLDGDPHQVVGILPASFRLPYAQNAVIFRPLALSQEELARRNGNWNYSAVVRLRPGAAAAQALAEINIVQAGFQEGLKANLISVHELVTGRAAQGLWMLAAAVGAVLLIVCINLANLLLSRMSSRSREVAIRTALGASRGRQLRQVLTESLLLSVIGGALGCVLADWLVRLLTAATSLDLPRIDEVRVDSGVLLFAFGLSLLTGLLFGALPAWRLTRHDPQTALRAGSHTVTEGRHGQRLRESLIGLEAGISAALLIVAGLLAASLTHLLQVDKGFDAGRVLTANIQLAGRLYAEDTAKEQFLNRLLAEVGTIPGVQAAAFTTALPASGRTWNDPIYLEGAPREAWRPVDNRYTSPGYFRALNIPIRNGRVFDESDRERSVAVLSEKAAKLLWPDDANPVGRRFMGEDDKPKTLVGIVAEVRATLETDPPPMAYYPYWQRPPGGGALVLRTTGDPLAAAGAVRAALRTQDRQLPIPPIRTMDEVVDGSLAVRRFQFILMAVFAASALLVAALGIYGVVSYSVTRRRNELGIRMALGAGRSQLLGMVVRQGMTPVLIGLAGGVAVALLVTRAIRGLLFGVEPADPVTIAIVAAALLGVSALACLIPARRAAGADAITALRFE
jgi:predicted permease